MNYYGRPILRQGKVAVYKDQIIGVSYADNSDQLAKFGMDVADAGGIVTLHLATGGRIDIDSNKPSEDAALWIRLAELDQ